MHTFPYSLTLLHIYSQYHMSLALLLPLSGGPQTQYWVLLLLVVDKSLYIPYKIYNYCFINKRITRSILIYLYFERNMRNWSQSQIKIFI